MALNKVKINKEVFDVEIEGATFTIKRVDSKTKKAFDGINKMDCEEVEKDQKIAEYVLENIVVSSKGVNEKWIAKHFIGNDTHFASRKVEDEDGDYYEVMRASFASAVNFHNSDSDYKDKATIAVNDFLEGWSQHDEPGGVLVELDADKRNEMINDESYEPLINELFTHAILQSEYVKPDLSEEEVKLDFERHLKDKERAITGEKVIHKLVEKAMDFDNFIEQQKKEDLKKGKS